MTASPAFLASLMGENATIRIKGCQIVISIPKWIERKPKPGEFTAQQTAQIKAFAGRCGGEITPAKWMDAADNLDIVNQVFSMWIELIHSHPIEPERFFAWKNITEKLNRKEDVFI